MQRKIELQGCLNFRDFGGYPTADGAQLCWRKLYRSDALHRLTPADIEVLRQELQISDVVDLRSTHERNSEGQGPLADVPIGHHHLPLFDGEPRAETSSAPAGMGLGEIYFLLAEMAKERVARIVEVMADAEGGVLVHCAAGKDRTGVISALVLSLLGVSEAVVIADYALSQENLDSVIDRLQQSRGYDEILSLLPPETQTANPETMQDFLSRLKSGHGSVRGYAESAGVSTETLARLQQRLVEAR